MRDTYVLFFEKGRNMLFTCCSILFTLSTFAQTATEDFNSTAYVFGGVDNGTNWATNSSMKFDGNENNTYVKATKPTEGDGNIDGNLSELKYNDASVYKTIDMSKTSFVDSDGDGIDDIIDLDDDNDGIPDLEEYEDLIETADFEDVIQPILGNNLNVSISPWILTSGGTNIVKVDGGTGYNNAGPRLDANPYTTAGTEQHYFDINGTGDLYRTFTLTETRTISYSGYFSPRDGNSGTASISIRQGVGNAGVLIDTEGPVAISDNGGDSQNAPWTYIESIVTLTSGTYSMVISMSNPTNFDEGKVQAIDFDSDGDGIVNKLDLDADNDGIYDAVEAGHGQAHTNGVLNGAVGSDGIPDTVQASPNDGLINYNISDSDFDESYDAFEIDSDDDACNDVDEAGYTDANNDGILGALPTQTDLNGLVTGTSVVDGYSAPNDDNEDFVFDFQQAGSVPVINTQPTMQTVFAGNNSNFSVVATGSYLTYQWQRSTDGGIIFTNMSDGSEYTGTTTANFTLLSALVSQNNYQFRVLIESSSYKCSTLTSATASLTVRVETVITNRKRTYRVKKN